VTQGALRDLACGSLPIDEGAGPVVLLVHGQPGTGGDWAQLATVLSDGLRVVAPDRLGWGGETRPAAGLAQNADDLAARLDSLGIAGPVTAVGHSLGGAIVLWLTLRHPEKVGALVLVSSVGVSSAVSGVDRLLALPMVGDGIFRAGVATFRRALKATAKVSGRAAELRLARELRDLPTVRAVLGDGVEPMVGRARESFLVEQRALVSETASLERLLGRVGVPTAVVHGASDRVVRLSAARILAARIPGAELVVLEGGHLLPFDRPEKVAAIVRRYVRLANPPTAERPPPGTPEA
jgi:pimeloyl-ACP methyl ester carboxylesterase